MSFVDGQVRVRVPATSANLGPGFDSLGLALTLFDELAVEVTDSGLEIVVDGEGAGVVPTGEDNLLFQAMSAAFDLMGETPPGLRLECTNRIPHGRGLGSSSAAIVAAIVDAHGSSLLGQSQARCKEEDLGAVCRRILNGEARPRRRPPARAP